MRAGGGQRIPVHVAMLAIPYNLLERLRLLVRRTHGEVVEEDFAAEITMTLQFPVESFDLFQNELRELTAGKLKAEVIESSEKIVAVDSI
jgi:putative IMPACT (imprinted ancient) family translation regulator